MQCDRWDFMREEKAVGDGGCGSGGPGPDSASVLGDDDIFAALLEKRAEYEIEGGSGRSDFNVELLGGSWTSVHRGVLYDAFAGRAAGREAVDLCVRFGLAKSFRCSTTQCGDDTAHVVAKAWCHLMQYMFDRSRELGGDDALAEALLEGYTEPGDVARAWEAGGPARARIEQLRAVRPRAAALV
jgi:hypothetical protein